jgi:hypothetical protein
LPGLIGLRHQSAWSPIRGDFELVELGTGFAVFAFLPWVQINRQHASVEILTMHLGSRRQPDDRPRGRHPDGLQSPSCSPGNTGRARSTNSPMAKPPFIIQYPIWWAYASGLVGAIGFV